jgi:hypothetical protein
VGALSFAAVTDDRGRMVLIAPVVAVVALLLVPPTAAAERWRWPVRGEVVRRFVVGPSRFAPEQHRGIDIYARAGTTVRAACSGRVRFAGRLPGRGRAVSVGCGSLVATHLGLGSTDVRRGAPVLAGQPIGDAAGTVQLGARRTRDRFGYVDPMGLLGADPAPPLGAAPHGRRAPRGAPIATAPSAEREVDPGPDPSAPAVAWIGLVLLGAGVPVGGLLRRRRRTARVLSAARTR